MFRLNAAQARMGPRSVHSLLAEALLMRIRALADMLSQGAELTMMACGYVCACRMLGRTSRSPNSVIGSPSCRSSKRTLPSSVGTTVCRILRLSSKSFRIFSCSSLSLLLDCKPGKSVAAQADQQFLTSTRQDRAAGMNQVRSIRTSGKAKVSIFASAAAFLD